MTVAYVISEYELWMHHQKTINDRVDKLKGWKAILWQYKDKGLKSSNQLINKIINLIIYCFLFNLIIFFILFFYLI
jgi:ABC-type lipoprotein release transport system permease subunit